jgi:hypothetical protein
MKKLKFNLFLIIFCILVWAVPSFADSTTTSDSQAGAVAQIKLGNTTNSGNVAASNTVIPQNLVGIINGSIGEYTAQLYHFSNPALTPLYRTDQIVKVLNVYSGHWYNHINLEDLEVFLLDKAEQFKDMQNVRFTVYFKSRITGGGVNAGGGGAMSSMTGSTSGGGQAGMGYFSSTFDPIFIVTFYEVIPGPILILPPPISHDEIKKEVEKDIHEILINLTIKVVKEELAAPVETCCILPIVKPVVKPVVKHHKKIVNHKCTKVIEVPCP